MLSQLVANLPLHFVQLVKLILSNLNLSLDDFSVSVNFPLESLVLLLLRSILCKQGFLSLSVLHDPSYPIIPALPVDRNFRVMLGPIWIGTEWGVFSGRSVRIVGRQLILQNVGLFLSCLRYLEGEVALDFDQVCKL